jgi:NTE family protein
MHIVERQRSVTLAIGGGGARGYAHIGAIDVLEERGFEIKAVAGSSMGALVGGLYAAGSLDEYEEFARGLSQMDVLRYLDVSLRTPGAIRADKALARVNELLGGALIEELAIPFTAVATDLGARKEVWFQTGPVATAIRASIALPGVITPVMLNGRLLADGGLMNPVPMAPTSSVHADITIAVSLAGDSATSNSGTPALETSERRPVDEWVERFRRSTMTLFDREVVHSISTWIGGLHSGDPEITREELEPMPFDALPDGLSTFDVMTQSLDAMQAALSRYRLAGCPPDIMITVPKDSSRTLDFHRAAEMIDLGRRLTLEALDKLDDEATPAKNA